MNLNRGLVTKFALISTIVSLLGFGLFFSFGISLDRQKQSFGADALAVAAAYRSAMDVVDGIATSLSAVPVGRPETQDTFAQTLLENYPFIQGVGRFRKVPGSVVEEFLEAQSIVNGSSSPSVWRLDEQGLRIAVGEAGADEPQSNSQDLYPVTSLLSPTTGQASERNMAIEGFDLGSALAINAAIRRATEFGKTEIVNVPDLWPGNGNVLAIRSLYRSGMMPDQIDERREAMTGGYWLEIDFDSLGSPTELVDSLGIGLSFSLVDTGSEFEVGNTTELHSRIMPGSELLFSRWLEPNKWISSFDVADRTYTIMLSQHRGMTRVAFLYWLFSVGGILVSLVVIAMLNTIRLNAVQEQRLQSDRLYHEQQRAATILLHIRDAVISTGIDCRIQYVNKAAEDLLQIESEQITGQPIQNIFDSKIDYPYTDVDNELFYTSEKVVDRERSLLRADGDTIWVNEKVSPVLDAEGGTVGNVVVLRDVTEEKEFTRHLQYRVNHDPLTGLANRSNFEERMQLLLEETNIGKFSHALCLIDLDRFKQVNDTCGHAAGDQLLLELSDALGARIRAEDLLARIGGDEFAVLIEHCDLEAARSVANRLHRFFNNYHFEFDNKVFPVRGSIGMVHFDPAEVDYRTVASAADAACYKAKSSGRNTVHVCPDAARAISRRKNEERWLPLLKHALNTDGFLLHVQPVSELSNGEISAPRIFEVLLRMEDAEDNGRLLYPSQFIKSAERYGLMRDIDEWVVSKSLKMVSELPEGLSTDLFSINLSSAILEREDFGDFLENQFMTRMIDPSKLCFEVAEESVLNNYEAARAAIRSMKQLGCMVALDDFGAGVSSLASLRELQLDYLKIDGRFMTDIENDPIDGGMVKSIHSFASAMGLKTVAEKVESKEACDRLAEIGVHYAQGYYIAPPGPLFDYIRYSKAA